MNGDSMKDNVCRDYLRNVCNRGSSCKFRHPEGEEAKALGKKDLIFCHDYQNKECRRVNCRFVHCSKQEEELYRSSGYIAEHIIESANQKGIGQSIPTIPVCKDFLKGECKRAGRCKFRHVAAQGQYQPETNNVGMNSVQPPRRTTFENFDQHFDGFNVCEPPLPKRHAYEETYSQFGGGNWEGDSHQQQYLPQHVRMLQEENARLVHKVEELKKQVMDLTATNMYLREQNEHIRGMANKDWYAPPYQNSYLPQ